MHPRIGDLIEPASQLTIEIIEAAERAGEEKIFADIAERPLDFFPCLGPVRPAGARLEAVVAGQVETRGCKMTSPSASSPIHKAPERPQLSRLAPQERLRDLIKAAKLLKGAKLLSYPSGGSLKNKG